MAQRSIEKFECMNCYDDVEAIPYRINPGHTEVYKVCKDCAIEHVVPAFEDSVKTETAYRQDGAPPSSKSPTSWS